MSEWWWRRRKRRYPWSSESDANPRFRRFEKPQPNSHESDVQEEREPLVDVIEEEGDVAIVAELPGAKKEDIEIHATKFNVTISVDTLEGRYHNELALPVEIDPESILVTYKNGVLQIRLKKIVDAQLFTR